MTMKQLACFLSACAVVSQAGRKDVQEVPCAQVEYLGSAASTASGSPAPIELVDYDTFNGMLLWPSLPKSQGNKFHSYLLNIPVTIPPHKYGPVRLTFKCSEVLADEGESCTAFIFLYRCNQCYSAGGNALASSLLGDSWMRVPCGAYFFVDYTAANAHEHRFTVFHKEVMRGEANKVSVLVGEETEFFFWGKLYKTETCTDKQNKDACTNHSPDCMWDGEDDYEGACVPKACPKPGGAYGPYGQECKKCVHDEDSLIDAQATPAPRP